MVDMQYYTFQTINSYKQHFEGLEKDIKSIKSQFNIGQSAYSDIESENEKSSNNQTDADEFSIIENKKIKESDVKNEEKELLSSYNKNKKNTDIKSNNINLPRFKEVNSKFDEEDSFFDFKKHKSNSQLNNSNNQQQAFYEEPWIAEQQPLKA